MTKKGARKQRWIVLGVFLVMCAFGIAACNPVTENPIPTPEVAITSDSAAGHLARGDAYAEKEAWAEAILEYDQAIRLKPDYSEAFNNRGYAHYWNHESREAIADLTRAIELRPNYPYAYNSRAAVYMSSAQPELALVDLNRALELQPDFPQAYTNRGNVYLRLGRTDLALADFERGGGNPLGTMILRCGIPILLLLVLAVGIFAVRRKRLRGC